MSASTSTQAPPAREINYPSSDGRPMAETQIHVRAIMLLFQAIEDFLANIQEVYISANSFWYWEEGNPKARRAPDVMVVKGAARGDRRSFFSWREGGAVPCFIAEIASEGTWRENLYEKRELYAQLGVREYFLFDPDGLYLQPALQGFRRNSQGEYVPVPMDADQRLHSEELGVYFQREGTRLRLFDAETGKPILTRAERVEQAQQRADRLEKEVARLRAQLGQASHIE